VKKRNGSEIEGVRAKSRILKGRDAREAGADQLAGTDRAHEMKKKRPKTQ